MLKESRRPAQELREFDKALVTATYFGFRPIRPPKILDSDYKLTEHCLSHPHYDATEKLALIRTYLEENLASLPHPLAIAYRKPISRRRFGTHALHLIGSSSGIAEATLVRTTLSILSEEGFKNLKVHINCIGDKDSMLTYERELLNHIRKFGHDWPEEIKLAAKDNIFNIFHLNTPEAEHLREMLPSSITALSAQARSYFKEVLEYIEAMGIEFHLTPHLVGDKHHTSHTIFVVKRDDAPEETLAVGYRYSRLSKLLGLRKEIPMAGVTIFSQPAGEVKEIKVYKDLPKPKFYLIQLGREAKIKTLSLIDRLRAERIAVHHFLGKDKLAAQLSSAENLRVSYLIIIGQKEALDNTATVRNIATRAQETIDLAELPRYLKNVRL